MPLLQPLYPPKSTNQSSAPVKSTTQTSLSSPIVPSNSSAVVKPSFLSGVSGANFSDWSPWSRCSATCGHQAVTHRKRTCKLIGGKTCQGSSTETKHCQSIRCPGIARKKQQQILSLTRIGLVGNLETEGRIEGTHQNIRVIVKDGLLLFFFSTGVGTGNFLGHEFAFSP